MASIDVSQTRSVVSNRYQVTTAVTAAIGMPRELFVFKVSGDYSNVATLEDLQAWPSAPGGTAFYRHHTVTQSFDNIETARQAAELHKSRLNELVILYTEVQTTFAGTETVTYTG